MSFNSNDGKKDLLVSISLKPHGSVSNERLEIICSELWMLCKTGNGRMMLSPFAKGNSRREITTVFEISSLMKTVVQESLDASSLDRTCAVSIAFNSIEPIDDPAHSVQNTF
jgi:hypothetical protein